MARNGQRRPPRPRIGAISPAPSREEAAAIGAAIERFLAETAPAPTPEPPASRWSRAALEEGVRAHAAGTWEATPSWRP